MKLPGKKIWKESWQKKASSLYFPGVRTNEWLKIKHHSSAEVIIAGFTEPAGARKYFGALVLGIRSGDQLLYAGHTGSGFNESSLKEMYGKLKPLIKKESPFKEAVKTNAPVTWVKPVLVCEVKFTEWTNDNKMRHPIFLRLRTDKKINEITMANIKSSKPVEAPDEKQNEEIFSFGRIKVKTTNLNKIFWPDEGITKGMVIDYYQQVADYILPYLKDRPQSLKEIQMEFWIKVFFIKMQGMKHHHG